MISERLVYRFDLIGGGGGGGGYIVLYWLFRM